MTAIKIGVIGAGGIARNYHLPPLDLYDKCKLVALAEISEENAKLAMEKFSFEELVDDYRRLLDRDDIDAIALLTRVDTHAEINPADAEKLGVVSGGWVKVRSPSSKHMELIDNSMGDGWYKFQVHVTSRIRPGSFSVSQSYGRWGAGARAWSADGEGQYHDRRIGAGFSINPLYMADPVLKDRCIIDPIGGGTQSDGEPSKVERV